MKINNWPESQTCIGCKSARFVILGKTPSTFECLSNCVAASICCDKNRIEATDEEWEAKF